MKLAFEKIIEQKNLDLENIPADLQKKITDMKKSKAAIQTRIVSGMNINPDTIENLKEKDTALVEEILDFLDIQNQDSDEDSDEDSNEDEDLENMLDVSKYDGTRIDAELSKLLNEGISEIEFYDIRTNCPHTYELLFEAYEANSENGVRTTYFEMIETSPNSETFKITKL